MVSRREFIHDGIAALATLGVGELIRLTPGEAALAATGAPRRKRRKTPIDYARARAVPSVCLNCSTVCGIVGHVVDGRLVKISGNPADPNNGRTICAKGHSGLSIGAYPERLLYPLKRVGRRGEGLWQRVTWEEAYAALASRIAACRDAGHPEQVALHAGRSRINDVIGRFMNAIGSPVILNHRALCSLNKRAANYATIGDTDWETVDAAHTKYLLNFGSNFLEAHQGHIHFVKRVAQGRFGNGAKLVTFDVRLSNTAGRSDEWHAPFPGTEGAIALAMAHVMMEAGEYDRAFVEQWTNVTPAELRRRLAPYTPGWAAGVSGLAAEDIERIALEFARARPHCAAFTNRGSHAHYNGFENDRAVIMLNVLAGSVGKVGGYTFMASGVDPKRFPPPEPKPEAPKVRTDLEDPPEYPLANHWQKMRVGELVYAYLKSGRAKLSVYLTYTLGSPTTWPEGRSLAVEVLKDEALIPFHACSDVVYSETAHYADLILPDATYLERWGLDTRNSYELEPYVTLRQPIVAPPGECVSFADMLCELGRRLGPDVARYFAFGSHEDFVRHQCGTRFEALKTTGVLVDDEGEKLYETYLRALSPAELSGTTTDPQTGLVTKPGRDSKPEAIGIVRGGKAVRGFKTPSRLFEILSPTYVEKARAVGVEVDSFPGYVPIPAHAGLADDRFVLVTFKWNVHTQARTAPQKYLSEIVHDNPMWINAAKARQLGIASGDMVEITTYRPKGPVFQGTGERLGSAVIRAFVTEGIHPRVLAVSNSLGQLFGGRAACGENGARPQGPGYGGGEDDADLEGRIWWDARRGGNGNGVNVNGILPIQPSPVTGMQAWFDTVCSIRKL